MPVNNITNAYQNYDGKSLGQIQNNLQQLGQGLQSGNSSGVRQDFLNLQQLLQSISAHQSHHHHNGETAGSVSNSNSNYSSSISSGSSSSQGSDDNIIGQSMKTVISQYLSNSIVGGLSGVSPLSDVLGAVLGGINISI